MLLQVCVELNAVLRVADRLYINPDGFVIITGHRGEEAQNRCFEMGRSKVRWPEGRHNKKPSDAVDIAPLPLNWSNEPKNLARFYVLAGVVMAAARLVGVELRWGGDWDRDFDMSDQSFDDLGHFEVVR